MIPRVFSFIFIWVGIGLGGFYWILESSLHAFIFQQGHFTSQILNPDPHEIWKRMLVTSLLILFGLFAQFSINARKQMARAIELANRELNQIFQTASVGMRVVDKDFNILRINETFARLAGVGQAEAVGKKCYEVFAGAMCKKPNCPLKQILHGKERVEYYVTKERLGGKNIPCILTANRFVGSHGELVGMVESFKDITDIKLAQEVIQLERDKLNRIMSNLAEGVSIVNSLHIIEYENKIHKEYFQVGKGKKCHSVYRNSPTPCEHCFMRETLNTGEIQHDEFVSSTGRSFEQVYTPFTDVDGKQKVIVLLRDVTEKKASLAVVMRTERLAALGELAAGVAHEINNPINGIINYAQILVNKNEAASLSCEIARRITKEGDRIAKIVEGLLSFARREKEGKVPVAIAEILSDSIALTSAQMRKDAIKVASNVPADLPLVLAQAQEVEQVFVNIISNARYALRQKYPGANENKILQIHAETVNSGDRPFVRVSFRDSGTGIPRDLIDRVQDPFFTTKSEGKRTGLGLSISHGIVNDHGGNLTIESVEGEFTRIEVDLPVWENTVSEGSGYESKDSCRR